MKAKMLADKYPIQVLELPKGETPHRSVDELLQAYEAMAAADPNVEIIATFDHFAHTKRIGGEIKPDILDAKNLVFCFGIRIPSAEIMAARPRTVGFVELADRFVISFLDAPNPDMNSKMIEWATSLRQTA